VGIGYQDWHILSGLEHGAGCLTQRVTQYSLLVAPILKPRDHKSHFCLLLVYAGAVIYNVPYALWRAGRNASPLGEANPCSNQ
jgi:hypothetical protein